MSNVSLTSPEAATLLRHLEGTAEGGDFEAPGVFPGLPSKTRMVILHFGNKEWRVQAYVLGLPFVTLQIKTKQGSLIVEEVK